MPFVEAWEQHKPEIFPNYRSGQWGPEEAEGLIAEDGYHWITTPIE